MGAHALHFKEGITNSSAFMLISNNWIYQACFPQRCLLQSKASLSGRAEQLLKEWWLDTHFPFWPSLILWSQFQAYLLFGLCYRSHCHSNLLLICYCKINVILFWLLTISDDCWGLQQIRNLVLQKDSAVLLLPSFPTIEWEFIGRGILLWVIVTYEKPYDSTYRMSYLVHKVHLCLADVLYRI